MGYGDVSRFNLEQSVLQVVTWVKTRCMHFHPAPAVDADHVPSPPCWDGVSLLYQTLMRNLLLSVRITGVSFVLILSTGQNKCICVEAYIEAAGPAL